MTLTTAAAFWAVSFLFVITPGADWAYAITAGLRHRTIAPAVGGLLAGHLVATAVVAAGVAAILAGSPRILTTLTVAGAAYLVWLGVGMLRTEGPTIAASAEDGGISGWRHAAVGLGISGLNPKVFLLFLALLPQFVHPHGAWPVPAQIVALGLVHVASCAVIYTVVGTGARTVLSSRPGAAQVVMRLSGSAMVVIGLVLVLEQVLALV